MICKCRKRDLGLLLLGAVCFPLCSFCQYFTIDTIRGESPYNSQFSFIFPQLRSASDQAAADAVNRDMVKDVLQIELGQQKRSIFENIWGAKEMDIAAESDFSFEVINNDADFLSMSISAEGCGAYCEHWTSYYNRESATGKKISLPDILTGRGLEVLLDSLKAIKNKRIRDRIAAMKRTLDKDPLSPDDKQDYSNAIDLYTTAMQTAPDIHYLSFSMNKKQMTLHMDRTLPHVIRALDEVDYDFIFDISTFRDYLSDYGKTILKP